MDRYKDGKLLDQTTGFSQANIEAMLKKAGATVSSADTAAQGSADKAD
jgi:hypothetical protein